MTKKAVWVGVNTYPPPANSLDAPVREANKWARRLREYYGFDVAVVTEAQATRQAVLDHLREMLRDASSGDHFIFGFAGHGGTTHGWKSDTEPDATIEHGLILYAGTDPLQQASITPSDLARLLEETKPPADARLTLVLDTCFAARYGDGIEISSLPGLGRARVLGIPDAVLGFDAAVARTFADVPEMVTDARIISPMILVAAGRDQTEIEVGPPQDRRLLFGLKALERLDRAFDARPPEAISSRSLIDEINPLRENQSAAIVGNTSSQYEPFAGGFPLTSSVIPTDQASTFGVADDVPPGADRASRANEPHSITIRILGLATFIERAEGDDEEAYRTRIVLPFDDVVSSGDNHHFGFVEVADRDMPHPWNGVKPYEYFRAGVMFSRWSLTRHRVRIANVAGSGEPVSRSPEFSWHVPPLTGICPELQNDKVPRPECFREYPDPALFSGFIDLQAGAVTIGELERDPTEFEGQHSHKPSPWQPRQTPISVVLTIPLDRDHAVITIEDRDLGRTVIYAKSGSTVLMGNAREADITGPGSGDGEPEHFLIYYKLAPKTVYDPALPREMAVPRNACTVTTYP